MFLGELQENLVIDSFVLEDSLQLMLEFSSQSHGRERPFSIFCHSVNSRAPEGDGEAHSSSTILYGIRKLN